MSTERGHDMSNEIIKFRCTDAFKSEVEQISAQENRSVSNYIKNLIFEDMKKREENKKTEGV